MGYNWKGAIKINPPSKPATQVDACYAKTVWNFDPNGCTHDFYGMGISLEITEATQETVDTLNGVDDELDDALCKAFAQAIQPIVTAGKPLFKNCFLSLAVINLDGTSAYIEISFSAPKGDEAFRDLKKWVEIETTGELLKNAAVQGVCDLITQFNLPQPKIKSKIEEFVEGQAPV